VILLDRTGKSESSDLVQTSLRTSTLYICFTFILLHCTVFSSFGMDMMDQNPWAQPHEQTQTRVPTPNDSLTLTKIERELLLLVFIHGFKGTDETFGDFPKRMEHLLSETIPEVKAESIVFPAYEVCYLYSQRTLVDSIILLQTKGELVSSGRFWFIPEHHSLHCFSRIRLLYGLRTGSRRSWSSEKFLRV